MNLEQELSELKIKLYECLDKYGMKIIPSYASERSYGKPFNDIHLRICNDDDEELDKINIQDIYEYFDNVDNVGKLMDYIHDLIDDYPRHRRELKLNQILNP